MIRPSDERAARDHTISIRATRDERDLIDRAAQLLGTSRSAFMLEAASREAESVMLDRTVFYLDDDAYAAFCAMLDAPPEPSEALRALLRRRAPWE